MNFNILKYILCCGSFMFCIGLFVFVFFVVVFFLNIFVIFSSSGCTQILLCYSHLDFFCWLFSTNTVLSMRSCEAHFLPDLFFGKEMLFFCTYILCHSKKLFLLFIFVQVQSGLLWKALRFFPDNQLDFIISCR